ncbi:MAG TPA: carboxylesterase family protein [Paludibacteraceae bacterium]|nr:carboxylesterase family protein [Paludibacteraceae bacterium]HOU69588.1 carboxylesterase family protein [Paludibacteraceae bacterium]HPH63965.1 carboxylesterase family protein [Paludibacteraceae bacterium]HQF51250.1 carboxylesterase family protein [Paludibacteraceae bacterium]
MMKKWLLSATLLTMMAMPSYCQILRTTVAQGEIEGVNENGFALYKKIPYAEAPVGDLRWKAPIPKKAWKGVYKSDSWGNRPPQVSDPNQNGNDIPMSEDCLYLSVSTPAKSKSDKLPVFVMIHGGGFSTGSYSGTQESFVREGIIYASIEYRFGALGFLCHPELAKESKQGLAGNYGILDQIEALKWVHSNIASFGGDPDKITICGESAGGISVSILCASPLCKGLFSGAISESGSSFLPVAPDNAKAGDATSKLNKSQKAAEKVGLEFQKRLGMKNLKQLRKVPFQTIIDSTRYGSFWPVCDGHTILDDQYKLYEAGKYNDVNILIGTNSDEGALFCHPITVAEYEKNIRSTYGSFAERMLKLYPAKTEQETYYAQSDIFRDASFAWGTYAWANLQSKTGKGSVYLYYFDQDSENTIMRSPRGGANHVAEMPFIYGYTFKAPLKKGLETNMLNIMSRYWINFTKTGNPNGDTLPYWSNYQQGQPTVMIIHNGFHLDKVPNQPQLDFFEDLFKMLRK